MGPPCSCLIIADVLWFYFPKQLQALSPVLVRCKHAIADRKGEDYFHTINDASINLVYNFKWNQIEFTNARVIISVV